MGRQPFGLASPVAWLAQAGFEVRPVDLSREPLPLEAVRAAGLIACYLPMHTATRLATKVIERVRQENPAAHLCCYGLYAPLNAAFLRARGVQTILGAEFEADLVALARRIAGGAAGGGDDPQEVLSAPAAGRDLPRLSFLVPDRRQLPPLSRYASLQIGDGSRKTVGYTEASRGCRHRCRHCPIVPVYGGRFRVVPPDVVLADIRAQVAAGAAHITFGDPDFLNGPRHARAVIDGLAREWPGLTYDVTVKVEHLLRDPAMLAQLQQTGCLFVTTAVEAVDDRILALLDKGHTRADFARAVALCREAGLALCPTFVAFTPWTTRQGYRDLLDMVDDLDLVEQVAPIQLAIRLIVTAGSRLLELPEIRRLVGAFDPEALSYRWTHEDPDVDALQREVMGLVGRQPTAPRRALFDAVRTLAGEAAGPGRSPSRIGPPARDRATVPYLNEPWYC